MRREKERETARKRKRERERVTCVRAHVAASIVHMLRTGGFPLSSESFCVRPLLSESFGVFPLSSESLCLCACGPAA